MKKRLLFLALLLAFAAALPAAPVTRDLGQGLAYHRVHQLPADLPAVASAQHQPAILDLRYVAGGGDEAAALAAWLKFNATARTPVFVLANADTGPALLPALAPRNASVIVLGAAAPPFTPDIAVKISATAERRAYDAFERGATADSLIAELSGKPRNDEAKLAKDRTPEVAPAADDSPASAPVTSVIDPATKPAVAAPPIDLALQRAVQLHRTLLALKKL
jgi:hypothetical protein